MKIKTTRIEDPKEKRGGSFLWGLKKLELVLWGQYGYQNGKLWDEILGARSVKKLQRDSKIGKRNCTRFALSWHGCGGSAASTKETLMVGQP